MNNNFKILIVDDEESLINSLSHVLTLEGYTLITANDGDTAIQIVKDQHCDAIILDIKMPGKDGFEVLQFVKQHDPSVKVIMLTGYNDLANAMRSKKIGADDFIGKPYDISEVLTTLQRLLNK
jgi:DNA-binding NtrC family response regulator